MIELDRHIEILLLKSDCVIVPGLGGFIASHIAARFDDNDSMFIPPVRTLGFNPKLRVNDSLLVQSYSETYDISYPEAFSRIENEVNELKQHIANNGSYELCDVGTLYINKDGNIEFKPCEAGILTPELYSLSSFEMKKIAALNVNVHDKKEKKAATVPFTASHAHIEQGLPHAQKPEIHTAEETNKNDGKIQIRISAVRNFAAAVVAIILFMLLGTPVNENNNTLRTSNFDNGIINRLVNESYTKAAKSDTETSLKAKPAAKAVTTKERPATNKTEAKAAKIQKVVEVSANNYYCIVLASRVTKANADAFVKSLIKKGFDKASVLTEKNRAIKVIYGKYETRNDAYNALKDLRGNENFYDAWVYQVKN